MLHRCSAPFVCLLLSASLCVLAKPASAEVLTTTSFGPPSGFGYVADGMLFPGSPFANRKVLEVRVYWDVVIPEGYDAADIDASVILPIQSVVTTSPWPIIPVFDLSGSTLGWTGSGTFNHSQTFTAPNLAFGPVGSYFTHQALGLPYDVPQVLPTSRIEIDYFLAPPGDTDQDGDVDDSDLGNALANYTGPIGEAGEKAFINGDTDGDGDVDDSDLGTALANYTGPINPAAVPEPTSFALLALGGVMLVKRRR